MENVFLHLVNMSITAGWIAMAVIILRLFLKKAPKWITVLLWGLVGLRLILPISIESVLSLIPSAETIPPEIVYSDTPQIHSGVDMFNSAVNPVISESLAPNEGLTSINPVQVILAIASIVWILGLAGMLIYTLVSYLRLRHKVRVSMSIEKNIFICDDINTPFILGLFRPRIYLPSDLSASEQDYVLRHEKAHIKRKDHLIKPLSFLLLSVYWFNPILWVAYILLCRDIELACDEKVIKDMEIADRKEYSSALLNCSVPRRMISACPLAFGEVSVKQRIRSVLSYKKPAFWISIVAIVLCIALSVGFLTNPVDSDPYGVKVVDSGSDIEGVSLELLKLDLDEDAEKNASIEIKWKNKNKESYTCGEEFYVYKLIDGEWVNIRYGDYAYVTIGYMIPAKGNFKHTYSLWNIEIDEVGKYRFESTFLRDKGDTYPTEYSAWVDFEVTKIPDFDENGYQVTDTHSDREGISANIVDLNLSAKKPYIEVMWINDNDYNVTCGEEFYIYKLNKGEWTDCRTAEGSFNEIAHIIPANGTFTHKYSLKGIDMSSMGTYRFEGLISSKGERVRITFEYPVKTKSLATTNSGSLPAGITGEVLSLTQKENHDGNSITSDSTLSVMWYNKAEKNISTVIEQFKLYKNVNNTWVDQRETAVLWYSTQEVTIEGSSMQIDYPLDGIRDLEQGQYKLEVDFYSKPMTTATHYTAWIEFTVGSANTSAAYENSENEDVAHYYFNESEEVLKPQITLYRRTRTFSFTLSGLSSYVPTGKYSTEGNILTLTADDGNKYVFEVIDSERLKFIADESAELPKYKFSDNEVARYPFNDGDIFRTKSNSTTVVYGDDLYTTLHQETADFDIDGDGSIEEVSIGWGDTSGVYSFRVIAKENGKVKYNNRFIGGHLDFSFEKDKNGSVYLLGTRKGYTSADGSILLKPASRKFQIGVKDGQIFLTENGLPYGYEMTDANCEKVAETITKYIEAYKTHDVEKLNSCFKERKINPTDTKEIDTFVNCVEDCALNFVSFKEVSDYIITAEVTYEMVYSEDYLPVGNRQAGYNLITCDFTFEETDGKFLITGMSMETVDHNQRQYFANHTPHTVPYTYDEIIEMVIDAFPWEKADPSPLIHELPDSSYMYRRHSDLSEIGYALIDLDGNGQDELIISSIDSTYVYDLYTISDGNTIHLFSSGERYTHSLYENGYIELGWSSGAACSGHDFYKLTDGNLEFLQRITLDVFYAEESGVIDELTDAGNDNTFFRSNSKNEKDYVHISDKEALDLIDSYKSSTEKLKIKYTPLTEYNN